MTDHHPHHRKSSNTVKNIQSLVLSYLEVTHVLSHIKGFNDLSRFFILENNIFDGGPKSDGDQRRNYTNCNIRCPVHFNMIVLHARVNGVHTEGILYFLKDLVYPTGDDWIITWLRNTNSSIGTYVLSIVCKLYECISEWVMINALLVVALVE